MDKPAIIECLRALRREASEIKAANRVYWARSVHGRTELISRNGDPFNSFDSLRKALTAPGDGKTVRDGEIVCLDKRGRPQFNDLLFHRGEPCFFAFDLVMSDGEIYAPND